MCLPSKMGLYPLGLVQPSPLNLSPRQPAPPPLPPKKPPSTPRQARRYALDQLTEAVTIGMGGGGAVAAEGEEAAGRLGATRLLLASASMGRGVTPL